jgi:hypothetical protein
MPASARFLPVVRPLMPAPMIATVGDAVMASYRSVSAVTLKVAEF